MSKQKLQEFYHKELNEIKQHKTRFGAIAASLVFSLMVFSFTNGEEEIKEAVEIEPPKAVANADKTLSKSETNSKLTRIAGLEKASEDVGLTNPFKVDVNESPVNEPKTENKLPTITPAFNPPTQLPKSIESKEPAKKIVLILKGTAISGDKKIAIIYRRIVDKNKFKDINNKSDNDSKNKLNSTKDENEIESLMLTLGDEVDGKIIIEIGKDSVIFDNGERLYLQKGNEDE